MPSFSPSRPAILKAGFITKLLFYQLFYWKITGEYNCARTLSFYLILLTTHPLHYITALSEFDLLELDWLPLHFLAIPLLVRAGIQVKLPHLIPLPSFRLSEAWEAIWYLLELL